MKTDDGTRVSLDVGAQSTREAFQGSLEQLLSHWQSRLKPIAKQLELAARQHPNLQKVYEDHWKPRIAKLEQELKQFETRARVRPTVCVMGKRGQGKTSLLQQWLGQAERSNGLAVINELPTGGQDTTACLIRLTQADTEAQPRESDHLFVDFLTSDDNIPNVTSRPDKPSVERMVIVRRPDNGDESLAMRVCRFPVSPDDDQLWLQKRDDVFHVSQTGSETLNRAQWYAKEARIPVKLEATSPGFAGRVLQVLDVLDAPGADSTMKGTYPEWKLHKNATVFQLAIRQIDLLLVVCSADVSAVNLGHQFQKDIWNPWVARCSGSARGRLILAFTHAAEFFADASSKLQPSKRASKNEASNFAEMIIQNVLDPLMVAGPTGQSCMSQVDAEDWPPIFFFERDSALDKYREGIVPGQASSIAEKLESLAKNSVIPANLPLGQRCILRLVSDWEANRSIPSGQVTAVKRWMIRSLCALLDPADRGYEILTRFVIDYATGGPIARNHCIERSEDAEQLARSFDNLLRELSTPSIASEAMKLLRIARDALRGCWSKAPGGPPLHLGECCMDRRKDVDDNARPLVAARKFFGPKDICRDIVTDVLGQVSALGLKWSKEESDAVFRAIEQCLLTDATFQNLSEKNNQVLHIAKEPLARIQAVGVERIARIMKYIAAADDEQIRLVAQHCFKLNVEEGELLQHVIATGVASRVSADSTSIESVRGAAGALLSLIAKAACPPPYRAAGKEQA